MTDDELKQALPSMLFTTGNLIWSSKGADLKLTLLGPVVVVVVG